MRFLLDANLPRSALALVQRHGHAGDHVRDLGLGHAPDASVAAQAVQSGAVLLTRDLDFSDIRLYPPAQHSGLVVLRMDDDAVAADIVRLLEQLLERADLLERLPGHLVILEPGRVRFRPPL